MLCSVYGARDGKKNRNKCGWKMAMHTQVKRRYIVHKTMSIAVGLDNYKANPHKSVDVMFVNGDCTRNYLSN